VFSLSVCGHVRMFKNLVLSVCMYINKNGWTALHYAARGYYRHCGNFISMATLLLDAGANVNARAKVID
jgi:hypothetical protein